MDNDRLSFDFYGIPRCTLQLWFDHIPDDRFKRYAYPVDSGDQDVIEDQYDPAIA